MAPEEVPRWAKGSKWHERVPRILAALLTAFLMVVLSPPVAHAADGPKVPIPVLPDIPVSPPDVPGISDCKEAPTPDSPGNGIAGFFAGKPDTLPPAGDPFAPGSSTTIYEQYGYAGLHWRTYDLGCGPDAMRNPDAVIGTAVSNWIMLAPIALTALTGSLTEVAFHPTFLDSFDPVVERVSTGLHENLFASWIPIVLTILGASIIFMARRSAFASTAAAIAWALFVVILATALVPMADRRGQCRGRHGLRHDRGGRGSPRRRLERHRSRRRRGVTGPRGDPLPRVGRGNPGQPGQCRGQEVRTRPLQVPGAHLA